MVTRRQYWVLSPNVKDDRTENQEAVGKWKEVICHNHLAIMGWSPDHGIGRRFKDEIRLGDIVLIARRKDWEPDVVGLGVVKGEYKEKAYPNIDDEPAYVRKLHPFILLEKTLGSAWLRDVLNCTWAMHELHPDRDGRHYDSHRKVCSWMNQQLGFTHQEGNKLRITKKSLDKSGGEQTYDYEVRTKKQVRAARRKEKELLDNYRGWLEKQGRKLSRLQIGQMQCDAWEEERRNLIEAKATTSRQDIRMAVGQLLDYGHQIRKDLGDSNKAILLPERPDQNDAGWVKSAGISIIWRADRRFHDNAGGRFI